MIGLLPVRIVICWIAMIYASLTLLLFAALVSFGGKEMGLWPAVTFAFGGSSFLQFLLFFWFTVAWRWFWRRIPKLNAWLYPDIHGKWDMEITLGGTRGHGRKIAAKAIVKQDFLTVSMTVIAPGSRSVTLSTVPKKDPESGLPQLHYIFQVTTNPGPGAASKSYRGAAILDLDPTLQDEITGIYWTSAETSGTYRLSRRRD